MKTESARSDTLSMEEKDEVSSSDDLKISRLNIIYKCGSFLSFAFSCLWLGRDASQAAAVLPPSSSLRGGSKSSCSALVLTCSEPKQTEKLP